MIMGILFEKPKCELFAFGQLFAFVRICYTFYKVMIKNADSKSGLALLLAIVSSSPKHYELLYLS
jgi:hypothetical protein